MIFYGDTNTEDDWFLLGLRAGQLEIQLHNPWAQLTVGFGPRLNDGRWHPVRELCLRGEGSPRCHLGKSRSVPSAWSSVSVTHNPWEVAILVRVSSAGNPKAELVCQRHLLSEPSKRLREHLLSAVQAQDPLTLLLTTSCRWS